MSDPPQMLSGPSIDPTNPGPTLIPRFIAVQLLREQPQMAAAMGITERALQTGELEPADPKMVGEIGDFMAARWHRPQLPPPTMGPADALNLHAELRAAMSNRQMHKWLGAWLNGWSKHQQYDFARIPPRVENMGRLWANAQRDGLHTAPTFLMAAEANPLLISAAETLPWSVVPTVTLPPREEGFLVFAAPYEITDHGGVKTMKIRAISWLTVPTSEIIGAMDGWPPQAGAGFMITYWTSVDDGGDGLPEDPKDIRQLKELVGTRLLIGQSVPLPIGAPLEDWPLFVDVVVNTPNAAGITGPISLIIAAWMLMRRPVLSTTRATLPPHVRKAARKKGRIAGDISVISLRKRPPIDRLPREGEPIQREYHYRWTVDGHWRHQPVGPGRSEREWIYIWAHVKGPADKPLKQKQRVYRVSGRP